MAYGLGNNKLSGINMPKLHKNVLLECDHCESKVSAQVIASYDHLRKGEPAYKYMFAKCPSCGEPFVTIQENFGKWDDIPTSSSPYGKLVRSESDWDEPTLYLPAQRGVSSNFPANIYHYYHKIQL